jgi:hypothetical protein
MKRYLNSIDFFKNHLAPKREDPLTWNAFNTKSQTKLVTTIDSLPGVSIEGEVSDLERQIISQIKTEIANLKENHPNINPDRLDIDLAIIFHRNLKKLNWARYQIEDYGMWRWLSMNFFLNEVFWRWGENDFEKRKFYESSKSCYDRLVGERSRRLFPLRYFITGERLYDTHFGYSLLEKLAIKSKEERSGGFGNLFNNLTETKLISPNDYTSKTMSKILLTGSKLASNDDVQYAFVRYNAYSRRLLNYASESIFEKEICLFNS